MIRIPGVGKIRRVTTITINGGARKGGGMTITTFQTRMPMLQWKGSRMFINSLIPVRRIRQMTIFTVKIEMGSLMRWINGLHKIFQMASTTLDRRIDIFITLTGLLMIK